MSDCKTVRLGEILQIQPKSKIKAGDGSKVGIFPFYTCSNELTKKIDTADYEGPALVFGTGGNASVHYVNGKFSTSTDCLVYKTNSNTNLSLINKYLRANIYLLENGFKGAGLKHISRDYISNIEIKLPDSTIQEKVVSQLDLLESNITKHKTILEKLDLLIKSRFIEMFGDSNYSKNTIGDLCYLNRYPTFYGFEYQTTGIPVIKIGNIGTNNKVTLSKDSFDYVSDEINNKFPDTQIELFDIVMAVRGDGSTAKRIGIIEDNNLYHANISPNLIIFRIKRELNPYYLLTFLLSEEGQKRLDKYVTKTAKKTITANDIKKIEIQVPPIELQNDFAAFVQQIDKSKFEYNIEEIAA